jgi:hypothetical protein
MRILLSPRPPRPGTSLSDRHPDTGAGRRRDQRLPSLIEFRLDTSSGVPTYLQLVQQVEHALRLGYLNPGDQLPRVRDVVAGLAINPNTALLIAATVWLVRRRATLTVLQWPMHGLINAFADAITVAVKRPCQLPGPSVTSG